MRAQDWDPYVRTESGLYVPEAVERERRRPIALDLFCGAGGFSLGMEEGGFDVIAACEYDATAAITYLYNLGAYPCQFYWLDDTAEERMERELRKSMEVDRKKGLSHAIVSGGNRNKIRAQSGGCKHFFFGDVRNLKGSDVLTALGIARGELDCVFGGPPCQGFSTAGRRNVLDPRNSLVFEFVRLVVELQPKTMVMENVPGLATMVTQEGLPVIDALCLALAEGGWGTLEACRKALGADPGRKMAVRQEPQREEQKAKAQRPSRRERKEARRAAAQQEQPGQLSLLGGG